MHALRLGYSPCPNDTFIFHAWVHGLLPDAPKVEERLADIDALNEMALRGELDVAKTSMHAYAHLKDRYALLHSGGALGRGCGPLIVARRDSPLRPTASSARAAELADSLGKVRVAIPGRLTTAALLAGLFIGAPFNAVVMPFDRIMPAVVAGDIEAGVIIHEGRFTFGSYGLRRLLDLGEWWEQVTGLPIPLGGIAVKRSLETSAKRSVEQAISSSLDHARNYPAESRAYVREHSQELSEEVCQSHIDLYVNEFSRDYGSEGEAAIRRLLEEAARYSLVPNSTLPLFWDEPI